MKPRYNGTQTCPYCSGKAVSLECEEASLLWCEYGHVVVIDPCISTKPKVVYEFGRGQLVSADA